MKKPSDTEKEISTSPGIIEKGEVVDARRRVFTRGAIVSSAVLLTLGNRPAWSHEGGAGNGCVSHNTYASWAHGNPSSSPTEYEDYIDHDVFDDGDHADHANPHEWCPPPENGG